MIEITQVFIHQKCITNSAAATSSGWYKIARGPAQSAGTLIIKLTEGGQHAWYEIKFMGGCGFFGKIGGDVLSNECCLSKVLFHALQWMRVWRKQVMAHVQILQLRMMLLGIHM